MFAVLLSLRARFAWTHGGSELQNFGSCASYTCLSSSVAAPACSSSTTSLQSGTKYSHTESSEFTSGWPGSVNFWCSSLRTRPRWPASTPASRRSRGDEVMRWSSTSHEPSRSRPASSMSKHRIETGGFFSSSSFVTAITFSGK